LHLEGHPEAEEMFEKTIKPVDRQQVAKNKYEST